MGIGEIIGDFINPLLLGIAIVVLAFLVISEYTYNNAEKESCDKIGMDFYKAQDSTFCVDTNGNAYYVKIDCKGNIFGYDCIPRIVSIGEIRAK